MKNGLEQQVAELERRAEQVSSHLKFASRPFVIEFAGTPKSGKTSTVEAIRHFFTRQGFRVHLLSERAALSPIPMKGHLFFNTWCACTMLAELLDNIETDADIIIVDRGLFDALVWLTLQKQRRELTDKEADTIEAFLLLERWRSLIDLVVVMNVSAEEAIRRENAQRISSKTGSIMNPDALTALSVSVKGAAEKYGPEFAASIEYDTTGQCPRGSATQLAERILDLLEEFLNPEILILPRTIVSGLPLRGDGAFSEEAKAKFVAALSTNGRFMRRSEAEADSDSVQVIACGVLTYEDSIFVFERKDRDQKSSLYGKLTLWQGTHVPKQGGTAELKLLERAIIDRITRYLFLSRAFPIRFAGYCWEANNEKSNRHMGAIFEVLIDNPYTATDLKKKEFRRGRGSDLGGSFKCIADLESVAAAADTSLETWSVAIVKALDQFRKR